MSSRLSSYSINSIDTQSQLDSLPVDANTCPIPASTQPTLSFGETTQATGTPTGTPSIGGYTQCNPTRFFRVSQAEMLEEYKGRLESSDVLYASLVELLP